MFIFEEEKILPFSAGRYKLNKFGEVLDAQGHILKTVVINETKFVYLEWVLGAKNYEVGFIVAIVRFNVQIPTEYWNQIEPIYEDGLSINTNLTNISYRFRYGPIEIAGFPGFFYIPYYTTHGVSLDGQLLNLKNSKVSNVWTPTKPIAKKNIKGGYRMSWAERDYGNSSSISRHRALGLTFIRYEKSPLILVMNHLNGIPGDDYLDNLEWTTRANNNKHAIDSGLTPNSVVNILMKNLHTGQIRAFNSIAQCARDCNYTEDFIRVRLKRNTVRYADSIVFKIDNGTEWPIMESKIKSESGAYAIVARDIFTGEFFIFRDMTHASMETKVSMGCIRENVIEELYLPTGSYNFRYRIADHDIDWPKHSEKHLKMYRASPMHLGFGVLVENQKGEEIAFFGSVNEAAKAYNVSDSKINRLCRAHKAVPISDSIFSFYKIK